LNEDRNETATQNITEESSQKTIVTDSHSSTTPRYTKIHIHRDAMASLQLHQLQ